MIEKDPAAENQEGTQNQLSNAAGAPGQPDSGTSSEGQAEGPQKKRDWYDYVTLGIAVVGLFGLWYYAYWAKVQAIGTTNSVAQQVLSNRPLLYHNGVDWLEKSPDGGIPTKVKIKVRWLNFGKSLAVNTITVGHIFVRPPEQPAPIDPDCDENIKVPKGEGRGAIGPDQPTEPTWGLAQGENLDAVNNGQVLYVSGCVYYFGVDMETRYFTDLCVKWAPRAPQDFPTCDESGRNYAH